MANLAPEEKKTEYITKKKTKRKAGPASGLGASGLGKKDNGIQLIIDDKIIELTTPKDMKSGGRVNLRGGGCAKRGVKKNAYGKNS
jgi:hypothetical protein